MGTKRSPNCQTKTPSGGLVQLDSTGRMSALLLSWIRVQIPDIENNISSAFLFSSFHLLVTYDSKDLFLSVSSLSS